MLALSLSFYSLLVCVCSWSPLDGPGLGAGSAGPGTNRGSSSRKGLNILELAPDQRWLVSVVREGWRQAWKLMMTELAPQTKDGAYARPSYNVNEQIGSNSFPIAAGQYHLYTGNPCPWCHRVLLAHSLNGGGWTFDTGDSAVDSVFGARDLRGVYDLCSPGYTGRCTAPLLVDKKRKRLVNNESAKIVRMFNTLRFSKEQHNKYFGDGWLPALSPQHLIDEIDEMNAYLLHHLNNGVYRAGFATEQKSYEEAVRDVHAALKRCNTILASKRFLLEDKITESDIMLLPTVVRFDAVYASLFKCAARMKDFPHIQRWMCDMYSVPGIAVTFDLEDARNSYFGQLFPLNPSRIVPVGPTLHDIGVADVQPNADSAREWFFSRDGIALVGAKVAWNCSTVEGADEVSSACKLLGYRSGCTILISAKLISASKVVFS